MSRSRRVRTACLALVFLSACVHRGEFLQQTERVIREESASEVSDTELAVDVVQSETRLTVRGRHVCALRRSQLVETTREYDQAVSVPFVTSMLLVGGLTTGLGVGYAFSEPSADGAATSASTPMSPSPEARFAGGVAVAALGSAAIAAGISTLIEGLFDEEERSERRVDPGLADSASSPCRAARGIRVLVGRDAVFDPGQRDDESRWRVLGGFDRRGLLEVDLARVLTPAFLLAHPPDLSLNDETDRLPLHFVGFSDAGAIDLRLLRRRPEMDEGAWLLSGVSTCASSVEMGSCASIAKYLRAFPEGRHADEARALLRAVQTRMEEALQREEDAERAAEQVEEARRTARQREAQVGASRRAARSACERNCAAACAGDRGCQQACIQQQCRN
jgi:hypothetical protein